MWRLYCHAKTHMHNSLSMKRIFRCDQFSALLVITIASSSNIINYQSQFNCQVHISTNPRCVSQRFVTPVEQGLGCPSIHQQSLLLFSLTAHISLGNSSSAAHFYSLPIGMLFLFLFTVLGTLSFSPTPWHISPFPP